MKRIMGCLIGFFFFIGLLLSSTVALAPAALAQSSQFVIQSQPGVDPQVEADTTLAIEKTVEFCSQNFHLELQQPVQVVIVKDTAAYQQELQKEFGIDEVAAARWAKTTDAVSGTNKIIRNAGKANSDADRIFLVAHEMVHQYQRQIGYPKDCVWLVEGMAHAVAVHVTEQVGRRPVAVYRQEWQTYLAQQARIPELTSLRTRQDWTQSLEQQGVQRTYRTAGLTTLELWDNYGWDKVLQFYKLSVTMSSDQAFQQVFGIPLTQFHLTLQQQAS